MSNYLNGFQTSAGPPPGAEGPLSGLCRLRRWGVGKGGGSKPSHWYSLPLNWLTLTSPAVQGNYSLKSHRFLYLSAPKETNLLAARNHCHSSKCCSLLERPEQGAPSCHCLPCSLARALDGPGQECLWPLQITRAITFQILH